MNRHKKLEKQAIQNISDIKKMKIDDEQMVEEVEALYRMWFESDGYCESCHDYLGWDSLDGCDCEL